MLWSLSNEKMISSFFGKITSNGVPLNALVISMAVACLSLLSSVFAPDTVYVVLVAISGFAVVVVWIGIVLSQYMFRKDFLKMGGDIKNLKFRTPLYPLV
jgi:histidine permease